MFSSNSEFYTVGIKRSNWKYKHSDWILSTVVTKSYMKVSLTAIKECHKLQS